MKKKGFTLIELLAVIVVLAIIALIATPIVMNTIKKSQKGAAERSADNYIEAVETAVATKRLEGNIIEGEYEVQSDGNLCPTSGCGENDKDKVIVEMSGNKPSGGTITIRNGQVTTDSKMTIGSYEVSYNATNKKYEATEKDSKQEPVTKTYTNGEEVYFNVTTGTKCTSSDYTETQSNTGVNSGCMKFYAFNDNGGNTLNLILDHNTTAMVAWNSTDKDENGYSSNANGPKEVLEKLKIDTASWQGTITPSNYTMDQSMQSSGAKYTIDYSEYKARLITAQEIATITGNTNFNERSNTSAFYFASNTTTASLTCRDDGSTKGCKHMWLYDRTSTSCTKSGCLNNSDQTTSGYWTSASSNIASDYALAVSSKGRIAKDHINTKTSVDNGVRPVITVLKSKLS